MRVSESILGEEGKIDGSCLGYWNMKPGLELVSCSVDKHIDIMKSCRTSVNQIDCMM